MQDMQSLGKIIVLMGLMVVVVGVVFMLIDKWSSSGAGWGWLGRLPGDFYIKRENFTFYFPLTTSILISVVASAILYFLMRR